MVYMASERFITARKNRGEMESPPGELELKQLVQMDNPAIDYDLQAYKTQVK